VTTHSDTQHPVSAIPPAGESPTRRPVIDEFDLLYWESSRLALSPIQARLGRLLVENFRSVVPRDELVASVWPGDADARRARQNLKTHMCRLRLRVEPVGLRLETIHSRGYILEPGPDHEHDEVLTGRTGI